MAEAAPAPGYTSTEFGVTVASALSLATGLIPAQYSQAVAAVAGLYVACRTLLKVVHALGYAKALPDLPELPVPAGNDFRQPQQQQEEGAGK